MIVSNLLKFVCIMNALNAMTLIFCTNFWVSIDSDLISRLSGFQFHYSEFLFFFHLFSFLAFFFIIMLARYIHKNKVFLLLAFFHCIINVSLAASFVKRGVLAVSLKTFFYFSPFLLIFSILVLVVMFLITRNRGLLLLVAFFLLAVFTLGIPFKTRHGKPKLIAHGGGSSLGPENTIKVLEKSSKYVYGVEIDLKETKDRKFILFHDKHLLRTTNAKEKFSYNRAKLPVNEFTLSELMQLDLDKKFVKFDPFGTVENKEITIEELKGFEGTKLNTLEEFLEWIKYKDLTFMFDLPNTRYERNETIQRVYEMIKEAGLLQKVFWITSVHTFPFDRELSSNMQFNKLTFTYNPVDKVNLAKIKMEEIGHVNLPYYSSETVFRFFDNLNIPMIVWTVDENFLFHCLWCRGIKYVTTNRPQLFSPLNNAPLCFSLTFRLFSFYSCFSLLCSLVWFVSSRLDPFFDTQEKDTKQ